MANEENILPAELTKTADISRKIWKFIIEIATDNSNCPHVNRAKELLRELSQTL